MTSLKLDVINKIGANFAHNLRFKLIEIEEEKKLLNEYKKDSERNFSVIELLELRLKAYKKEVNKLKKEFDKVLIEI